MTSLIEPTEIQRLVDGRLPADERALLLEWADDHPENWRLIALAFVEQQALSNAIAGDVETQRSTRYERSSKRMRPSTWLLAACSVLLLLSVTANVWSFGSLRTADEPMLVESQPDVPQQSAPEPTFVLWVPDQQMVSNVDVEPARTTPLDEIVELLSTPVIDDEARQLFADVGFEPVEEPNLYLVEDDEGRGYVVPQRRVTLRPVSYTTSP